MMKLDGITISTVGKGIAVDTHFTNREALVLAGLFVVGTIAVADGVCRLGIAFVEKVKERI